MIQAGDNSERHTIPRWNSIEIANSLGETSPVRISSNQLVTVKNEDLEHLKSLLITWKNEKNLPLAVEIITVAETIGEDNAIQDVKQYAKSKVTKMENPPFLLLESLGLLPIQKERIIEPEFKSKNYQAIALLKKALISSPRNALGWCELARNYLIIGQLKKSERALQIALKIAPEHRTVIRAITRYYSHIGDFDQGLYYLRKNPILLSDPWVLASEIALSNLKGRTSKLVKQGQQMLSDSNINPAALSELASELGTMDFISGNNRRGKKKLEIAKVVLHENAMAQMVWINQKICKIETIFTDVQKPRYNYEADAKRHIADEDWVNAVDIICDWQNYQPFSKQPAMEGSYIAVDILNDPKKAVKLASTGLSSNPNDKGLLNNYAYSQIMAGNLSEAFPRLNSLVPEHPLTEDDIMLTATLGLYYYRQGNPEIGRALYQSAIEQANKTGHLDLAYRANIYFAREEKRLGKDISPQFLVIYDGKNQAFYQAQKVLIEKFGLLQ